MQEFRAQASSISIQGPTYDPSLNKYFEHILCVIVLGTRVTLEKKEDNSTTNTKLAL